MVLHFTVRHFMVHLMAHHAFDVCGVGGAGRSSRGHGALAHEGHEVLQRDRAVLRGVVEVRVLRRGRAAPDARHLRESATDAGDTWGAN